MRVLLQKVSAGSVKVDGVVCGAIEEGFVALIGVTHEDTSEIAERLALKTVHLRVFSR